ncbi:hypothetical protein ACFV6G_13090 [Streptomyces lavendulae]|uniref:hypothetical protein n=1 Tax=Streptomyces lavendulae TaxID=1914 RepID=UPI0036C766EE
MYEYALIAALPLLATVLLCALMCLTTIIVIKALLRGSLSADRPEIVRELARIVPHLLTAWWRRK